MVNSFYCFQIRVLSEQLNEANIKLNEEKETVTTLK